MCLYYLIFTTFNAYKMKTLFITIAALLTIATISAQIKNAKTETVKVYGNCSICKATIEKAAHKKNISKVDWNKDTKMAVITYDGKKTNLNALLKSIALAGYDNQGFLAPDAAYNKLQACCKYDKEKKTIAKSPVKDTPAVTGNHTGHSQTNPPVTQQANQLQAIFDNYFTVKDALVNTDAAAGAKSAGLLLAALNAVKMETLKMDEHVVWMKVEKDLKMDAQHIAESKEIDHQRDHFISLSKNMITLMKAAKPATAVYLQHCPMADDGKGADWLSKENAVKNPYYGNKMLTCGKTVETIKQ
jgi:copper chaperone CopZ